MTALLTPPTATAWPRPVPEFHGQTWTADDFHDIPNPERFEGRRLFLLHGEIWEQGRMNPPHATFLYVATDALRRIFDSGFLVRPQLDLQLDDGTKVVPDVLVVRGSVRDFLHAHPTTADLIVEVSDTTLFFDTTTKAELYATAGVPDYWVLDVNARRLLVFRDPAPVASNGHAYRLSRTFAEMDTVTPVAAPTQPVRVAELLP
jgi:Uma2 family endonuclease